MSTEELSLPSAPKVSLDRADRFAACADHHRMLLVQDRARIAQDLHDHVVQHLFGTGLALQNLASGIEDPALRARIEHAVDGIDEAISHIRAAVFALSPAPRRSARHTILEIAHETTDEPGPAATVTFRGPVDRVVTARLLDDVSAVVRESLTNVVRHANATTTGVELRVSDEAVSVIVDDDGSGIAQPGRLSGLRNIQERAAHRGGEAIIESRPGRTSITWIVPCPHPHARPLSRS